MKATKSRKFYLKATKDDLELPIAVADSPGELAMMLGLTKDTVQSSIAHGYKGWYRIVIEEDDNET